jgi:small-conductance mechanosensitive channel
MFRAKAQLMIDQLGSWDVLRPLTWNHVVVLLAIVAIARLLAVLVRRALRHLAESTAPRFRLSILRVSSVLRLAIGLSAILLTIPILVEPTPQNVIALIASAGVVVALALKDYASSIVAGLAAILENVYQPGDWIAIGGTYGEVKAITLRAVRLVTADDTEVIIPHSRLWSSSVANATGGKRSLLCVTHFYLHPDHDAPAVCRVLEDLAATSAYRSSNTASAIVVTEQPWGTDYKLKAYVTESRDQFTFTTDLTVRGKAALRALGVRFANAPYAVTGAL